MLLAAGLALKVTSAFVLVPLLGLAPPRKRLRAALLLALALLLHLEDG